MVRLSAPCLTCEYVWSVTQLTVVSRLTDCDLSSACTAVQLRITQALRGVITGLNSELNDVR